MIGSLKKRLLASCMIVSVVGCAATSTNLSPEQRLEMGAVIVMSGNVDGATLYLGGSPVDTQQELFRSDQNGFLMNVGALPPGILPAMFADVSEDLTDDRGRNLTATHKNLKAGNYAFISLYDTQSSACFHEGTKVFDVEPGYVNLVALPSSTGFLKKGFFESQPEDPSVDWDHSASLADEELMDLYEESLKEAYGFDMPVRVSDVQFATFEPNARPSVSYTCLLPKDGKLKING